jgi:uncharacterized protein (DUF58 family)
MKTTSVPTARAVILLGLLAPIALAVGVVAPAAWVIVPIAAATLLGLTLVDAALAGRLVEARVVAPREIEVGAAGGLAIHADFAGLRARAVHAALTLDPRLAPGGRVDAVLAADPATGLARGAITLHPARRGLGRVEALSLRWSGPFGLGARQAVRAIGEEVRVLPNIAALRSPALQAFLRDSEFGLIARRLRGEGTTFEALAEYQPGMDRRRIDWKSAARHTRLLAREYEAERNNQIVFALDCGRAMCEPVDGVPRIDRAISAALTTAWVALKAGDRAMVFGFASKVLVTTPFVLDTRGFRRLQEAAAMLDYAPGEPNFTLAMATLATKLQRRALIVVLSDFTDPAGAELMLESVGRLAARHKVIFVTLADEELDAIAAAPPTDAQALAMAVSANALLRARALVIERLRQLGVAVIEAPHDRIGPRLLDAYLATKRGMDLG